ncbi:hypothetical protein [Pseudomonas sp. NCCP-436]|uniref:hypothetical protein n=1 Tax=Pseudomonas sp. NCCP-436 TaxID=2842481 RepID=UPI001C810185|nr:hypothetical protein [Pseudomonas sp. NCCP-436]GIZ10842.1 hypothetical protein NCCP436_02580 [Pseudomonas sp. NCCP-436]
MKLPVLILSILGLTGCINSGLEQLYPVELWDEKTQRSEDVSIKEEGWYTVGVIFRDPPSSFSYEEFSKIIREPSSSAPRLSITLKNGKSVVFEGQFNVTGTDGRHAFRLNGQVEDGHHKILKAIWLEKGNYKISYHTTRPVGKYKPLETYLAVFRHNSKV